MLEKSYIRWVYLISILFIGLNAYLVIKEMYWGFLLPAILLVLILCIYSLDKVVLLITFATPLAVLYRDYTNSISISLPTEPLLFGVLLIFILRQLLIHDFDKKIWKHPVSLAVMINILWMIVTTISSEMPVVSAKYVLSRLWFVIPIYFVGTQMFRDKKGVKTFLWFYIIPLIGVIFYTIYNHSLWGFAEEPGHWVMSPFFNDHTAYGAALSLFIPVALGMVLNNKNNKTIRLFSVLSFLILGVGLFFSFSRAAWVSVVAALVLFLLLYFHIRMRTVLAFTGILIGVFLFFQEGIFQKLEKNKQDSSSNLVEHVQSISNISSDASNLERINRWNSALRMFHERPFLGWGPGTYQFLYAPFQNSQERTIISTNAGDKGNAHSEYFGPLAESGWLGMLSFLAIAILIIFTGIKTYQKIEDPEARLLVLSLVLGLFTYLIHGLLNNFLDSDKASIPFWGFAAAIVAFDVYYPKKNPVKTNTDTN